MSEARLERLEERLAWIERHVVEQDKVMLAQADELQRLKRELAAWRERAAAAEASRPESAPADERPPHY
ncbi:MAG TPA: SlyX family protein [Candidatus Synoicihabitans sp.]|nr:SlyX family protein [Candidatus Synoicihabitans sp.]